MDIILAEERGGQTLSERSFNTDSALNNGLIVIGRDGGVCDLAFDKNAYPMVSRTHLQIFWSGGWYATDLNSSYGTFINGTQFSGTVPLTVGSLLQIGKDGPALRVVWFEMSSEEQPKNAVSPTPTANARPVRSQAPPTKLPTANPAVKAPQAPLNTTGTGSVSTVRIEFDEAGRKPYPISGAVIWLGRDPSCDVVFESSTATVSRRHAEIRMTDRSFKVTDNNSFNGTVVNGVRISEPTNIDNGDTIQLGVGGPILRLVIDGKTNLQQSIKSVAVKEDPVDLSRTMVIKPMGATATPRSTEAIGPQLLRTIDLDNSKAITIGRGDECDITLDGLQISKRHAKFQKTNGGVTIEDLGSTNGVFVNGERIGKRVIAVGDIVQIGLFTFQIDNYARLSIFDTRSKTTIEAKELSYEVKSRNAGGKLRLLDGVSLSIKPNEFVGIIGPSGSGKSTLLEVMNGVRRPTTGTVSINHVDLYSNFQSLKQAIGYVPQDDIIHRELTVYNTLYYVAKLRLSRDVSSTEINRILDEVLDVTGLNERRDTAVNQLSGGQRKRVSIAVELITKPSVIYLDEPTSGLDPAIELRVMELFRQIAESGRTVVMTTHAMENVQLFDKIVVLSRGRCVYYGKPDEALRFFGVSGFSEMFAMLDGQTINTKNFDSAEHINSSEKIAQEWKLRYQNSPQFDELVRKPLSEVKASGGNARSKRSRLGIFGSIRQWLTLTRRYSSVLFKNWTNLFILIIQAPIIALLTFFVADNEQPRDFVYFVVSLVAIWFGTSVAAREIIRERAIFRRERMFNLGLMPYLGSKLFVLGIIVFIQCFLVFVPLKLFDLLGIMSMPGELFGIPQFWSMLLTAGIGISLGLLVSAFVKTPELATSLIPLLLIPQILFSGIFGVPAGINKVVGMTMPSAWAFDTMKRFSTLDTLEPEGADPRGETKGLGLYKFIEDENDKTVLRAKRDLEDFRRIAGPDYREDQNEPNPLSEKLEVPEVKKLPDDLSGYVTYLHPQMHEVLNQAILMLMFLLLTIFTLVVLKIRNRDLT